METPQRPEAMLIADHGTTPTRRKTASLTQAADLVFVPSSFISGSVSPSKLDRVMSRAFGNRYVRYGANGIASSEAHTEPIVVSRVRSSVANAVENSAPANTFQMTLPGIDQACFHIVEMAMTAMTCNRGPEPLCE